MITNVKAISINELIPANPGFYYQIPKYQRAYVWKPDQITEFYNDLAYNNKGMFIGPMICIAHGQKPNLEYEVIDGQQRLTTLCLMLGVLYKKAKDLQKVFPHRGRSVYSAIPNRLKNNYSNNGLILIPQHHNLDDFNYAMHLLGKILPFGVKPGPYGTRKIAKAVTILENLLDTDLAIHNKLGIKELLRLKEIYERILGAVLVKIQVDNHSEAYMLFESLNNRGVPLTSIELMKNTMLAEIEKKQLSVNANERTWQNILNLLKDDTRDNNDKVQERFFRHHYNAFKKEINAHYNQVTNAAISYQGAPATVNIGSIATRSTMLNIYDKIIKNDVLHFLTDINQSANIYHELIQPVNCHVQDWQNPLLDLLHVQAAPSYMLLLYLVRKQQSLGLNDKTIEKIIELLVNFFIRRNLTDTPNTRELDRMFMDIIKEIETKNLQSTAIYQLIKNELVSVSADINLFIKALMGNIYDENRDATRFVLCYLAKDGFPVKTSHGLWDRDKKGNYIWTIEHVFPQGDHIPEGWIEMMTRDKTRVDEAKKIQKDYVHRLGNLTLTGYNSELGNYSFIKKRDRKDKTNSYYIGYKNEFSINKDLATKRKWRKEDIRNRTVKLVTEAVKKFLLPGEQMPKKISFPKIP